MLAKSVQPFNQPCMRRIRVTELLFTALVCTTTIRSSATEETREASTDRATVQQPKENLRYAGRTFDDWRQQLLNDLDPKTCAAAMEPMAAFGKMGYAGEAVAALRALLRTDRAAADNGTLAMEVTRTLARIGPAAVPVLTDGLADSRPTIRQWCAYALGEVGDDAHSAKEPLLKLLADKQQVRIAALRSLTRVASDDEDLQPVFQESAQSDDQQIRLSFVIALSAYPPKGDWWVPLFVQLADDEDGDVRQTVGRLLAQRGAPQKEVVAAVERLMCDANGNVSLNTTTAVAASGNMALLLAVLSDGIESSELWRRLHMQDGQLPQTIAVLGRTADQAASSVPLLIRIAAMKAPSSDQRDVLAAIDALGKLGTAAEDAIPMLERLTARDAAAEEDVYKKHAWRALKKIRGD